MIIITQRGFRGAGQRGGIDNQLRLLRRSIDQAISQHQATFRIGIHDFHGFTVAIVNNIAKFKGVAANQVIGAAQIQLHALIEAASDGKRQRAGHRCRAAHVGLHRVHKGALLDAVSAGVKGDAFTDQAGVHRGFFIAGWVIVQRQQDRRALGAATDRVQAQVVLLAQVFTLGDTIRDVIAGHAAQQVYRTLRQLFRPQLFRRGVNGVMDPVNNGQAVIQFAFLRIVEGRPLHFAAAFRPLITRPERPCAVGVPAFAIKRNVFDAHAVNFPRRALNQTQVVFAVQVQGDAVVINAVRRFFSPARIGWLSGKRNFHSFGHYHYPS